MVEVKVDEPSGINGPEHDIFDLHPATLFAIFTKLNVNISECQECRHKEMPYFYAPDKGDRTVPRVSALGLSETNAVTFTPSTHLPVCYLACRNCGYIRMFSAYPLLEQITKLGLNVEGRNVHFTK